MIAPDEKLSLSRQCRLIGLPRSSYYYRPKPLSDKDKPLMERIDEIFTENPDFGSRKIRDVLRREGNKTSRKKVQRLMNRFSTWQGSSTGTAESS